MDLPLLIMAGNSELRLENYQNLKYFSENKIVIKTKSGKLILEGKNLNIELIEKNYLTITGQLSECKFNFTGAELDG